MENLSDKEFVPLKVIVITTGNHNMIIGNLESNFYRSKIFLYSP